MTLIRVLVMLFGYIIWIFANGVAIGIMDEIMDTWWYYGLLVTPETIRLEGFYDEVKQRHDGLVQIFPFEFALLTWVYTSMVSLNS
jgi:hypothetical protein